MELFMVFAVVAAFLFATASIFSKHFLDVEVEDYVFTGAIFGWPFFALYTVLGVYGGEIATEPFTVLSASTAGALYSLILILYLRGLETEEASRFIPTLALNTIFLALFSFVFLGQQFSTVEYLGILMAVAGSILISIENPLDSLKHLHSKLGTGLAVLVAVLIGVRDTLLEFATVDLWSILVWMGLGGFTFSLLTLLVYRRKKLSYPAVKERVDMLSVGAVRSLGFLAYLVAISLGPAAKASATLKLNGMLVFFGATMLGWFRPRYIREEVSAGRIIQKFVASAIIIIGVILVQ